MLATYKYIIGFALFTALFFSCKKETPSVPTGHEYFPLTEGSYVLYEVLEVRHDTDLSPVRDSNFYYVKEIVGPSIVDGMQDTAYKFFRYIGHHPDSLFIKDVWTIKRTQINAQKVEENIRFLKLAFAVTSEKEWDGNALNNYDELIYSYDWIGEPFSLNGLNFNETTKVLQNDFYTFVDYLSAYEIYAKNVGMIKKVDKEFYITNFDTINVLKGKEIIMEAIEYGIE